MTALKQSHHLLGTSADGHVPGARKHRGPGRAGGRGGAGGQGATGATEAPCHGAVLLETVTLGRKGGPVCAQAKRIPWGSHLPPAPPLTCTCCVAPAVPSPPTSVLNGGDSPSPSPVPYFPSLPAPPCAPQRSGCSAPTDWCEMGGPIGPHGRWRAGMTGVGEAVQVSGCLPGAQPALACAGVGVGASAA